MFHVVGMAGEIKIKDICYTVLEYKAELCGFVTTIFTDPVPYSP